MANARKNWLIGLGVGTLAGVADVVLIFMVDSAPTKWVMLESFLFWAVTGWAVVASDSGLGRSAHGIVVTVLLNLPWYVLLGPAVGKPEHVPPLLVMSAVFGALFGWARGRARQVAAPTESRVVSSR